MMNKLAHIILVSTLGILLTSSCHASDHTLLQRINHKISSVTSLLKRDKSKRSQLQKTLAKTETRSGQVAMQLHTTQTKIKKQQKQLRILQKNEKNYQRQLQSQQQLLAKQLRANYLLGRNPYLQILLNEKDLSKVSRTLTYYHYLNDERANTINSLQTTLKNLQTLNQQIDSNIHALTTLEGQQLNEKSSISSLRAQRKRVISKLNKRILTRKQKLQQLQNNKSQLESTIAKLQHQTIASGFTNAPFTKQKGKLPWPTLGSVVNLYGKQINHSQLTWSGILIKAKENTDVHAVAPGNVIFSKWLAGYGLLLIISHNNGYMTLYGRNHYLYKKVGDTVKAGELIAKVGRSGGYKQPALYFAIRHNGTPINPMRWCRRTTRRKRFA